MLRNDRDELLILDRGDARLATVAEMKLSGMWTARYNCKLKARYPPRLTVATITPATTLTAEAFWQHHNDKRRELVRGEVIETMPPGGKHGPIQGDLYTVLRAWSKQNGGYVTLESGFLLSRDPDTVRGPDVAYVRQERIPTSGVPEGFWQQSPDLVIEVVSPGDTAEEIRAKVSEYLAAGVSEVWVAYSRTRQIIVYKPNGLAQTFESGSELTSPELLPGLRLKPADIFQ